MYVFSLCKNADRLFFFCLFFACGQVIQVKDICICYTQLRLDRVDQRCGGGVAGERQGEDILV